MRDTEIQSGVSGYGYNEGRRDAYMDVGTLGVVSVANAMGASGVTMVATVMAVGAVTMTMTGPAVTATSPATDSRGNIIGGAP